MEQFDISEEIFTLQEDPSLVPLFNPELIGYQWVASRGKRACPKCTALHGKKFYVKPRAGQASVDDMPKGQLHPNCGCTPKPMVVLRLPFGQRRLFNPTIPDYMADQMVHDKWGAMVRVSSLNSKGKAPIYRKFGGDFWTAGRDVSHLTEKDMSLYDEPADDDLDEVCKQHDMGYDVNGRDSLDVDRKNVADLEKLDPNPENWSTPPETDDDLAYAYWYRKMAAQLFRLRVKQAELDKLLRKIAR